MAPANCIPADEGFGAVHASVAHSRMGIGWLRLHRCHQRITSSVLMGSRLRSASPQPWIWPSSGIFYQLYRCGDHSEYGSRVPQETGGVSQPSLSFPDRKYGQLQEWSEDFTEATPGIGHVSNLFPVYPGHQITPQTSPQFANAAGVSLDRRMQNGAGDSAWPCAWYICLWARLGESEKGSPEGLQHAAAKRYAESLQRRLQVVSDRR